MSWGSGRVTYRLTRKLQQLWGLWWSKGLPWSLPQDSAWHGDSGTRIWSSDNSNTGVSTGGAPKAPSSALNTVMFYLSGACLRRLRVCQAESWISEGQEKSRVRNTGTGSSGMLHGSKTVLCQRRAESLFGPVSISNHRNKGNRENTSRSSIWGLNFTSSDINYRDTRLRGTREEKLLFVCTVSEVSTPQDART